jgi:hypothetical protein
MPFVFSLPALKGRQLRFAELDIVLCCGLQGLTFCCAVVCRAWHRALLWFAGLHAMLCCGLQSLMSCCAVVCMSTSLTQGEVKLADWGISGEVDGAGGQVECGIADSFTGISTTLAMAGLQLGPDPYSPGTTSPCTPDQEQEEQEGLEEHQGQQHQHQQHQQQQCGPGDAHPFAPSSSHQSLQLSSRCHSPQLYHEPEQDDLSPLSSCCHTSNRASATAAATTLATVVSTAPPTPLRKVSFSSSAAPDHPAAVSVVEDALATTTAEASPASSPVVSAPSHASSNTTTPQRGYVPALLELPETLQSPATSFSTPTHQGSQPAHAVPRTPMGTAYWAAPELEAGLPHDQ